MYSQACIKLMGVEGGVVALSSASWTVSAIFTL